MPYIEVYYIFEYSYGPIPQALKHKVAPTDLRGWALFMTIWLP